MYFRKGVSPLQWSAVRQIWSCSPAHSWVCLFSANFVRHSTTFGLTISVSIAYVSKRSSDLSQQLANRWQSPGRSPESPDLTRKAARSGSQTVAAFVVIWTVLVHAQSSWNPVLAYPLYPGLMVHLLITGGHGGTLAQEKIAFAAELGANLLAYLLATFALLRVIR